jgi:hypothetical protein
MTCPLGVAECSRGAPYSASSPAEVNVCNRFTGEAILSFGATDALKRLPAVTRKKSPLSQML